ncbi:hypothetical protein BDQ12DRAFT_605438 [Crucibulum laeve]|uniref:Uncharacterized protein n=1 Tax=Crucibulum laeve TaxID=68775 RepID=A0A5C3M300_9AGAR|nr:hypothetical protein BDQ12DRAFT_605438 [Crucibulum laeve]
MTSSSPSTSSWDTDYYHLQSKWTQPSPKGNSQLTVYLDKQLYETDTYLPPLPDEMEEKLQLLVKVADLLEIDDVSFASYSAAITRITSESLSLSRTLNRLKFAEQELEMHFAFIKHEHRLIKNWQETIESDQVAGKRAANIDRHREALIKEAKGYRNELNALLAEIPVEPEVTVTQLAKQQEMNKALEQKIKAKRAKIKAFQGLPPNLELARHEVRIARDEQMKLIQLRERLLGRMAESVS